MSNADSSFSPPLKPSRLRRAISVLCSTGITLGCLAQLTFRDRYPFPGAIVFYALPRPLLLTLALVGLIVARRLWSRLCWGALGLLLAVWVSRADVAWNSAPGTTSDCQLVVCWNVGHDLPDDVEMVDRQLARKPAVLGLSETGVLPDQWLARWREKHPDYEIIAVHRELLLAVRGKVIDHQRQGLLSNSHSLRVDAEIDGVSVRIVLVDIVANPWIPRREPMQKLAELLPTSDDRPIIVMGDFNAPDDSVWFKPLRAEFREAFRTAGQGYAPTWPWPAPLLKLDQIWVNRHVEVCRAWQQKTWHSDHRIQFATVKFRQVIPRQVAE